MKNMMYQPITEIKYIRHILGIPLKIGFQLTVLCQLTVSYCQLLHCFSKYIYHNLRSHNTNCYLECINQGSMRDL